MNIYVPTPGYSPTTGKLIGTSYKLSKYACDYCGAILDPLEMDCRPDPIYKVLDGIHIEPQWDGMELKIDGKKVNLLDLNKTHNEFVYCQPWMGGDFCTALMSLEWTLTQFLSPKAGFKWEKQIKQFLKDQGIVVDSLLGEDCRELVHMMYECRHRVIPHLCKSFTPEQLCLTLDM